MFRRVNKLDLNKLARIHFLELRFDFLPSLGENFLRQLYSNLAQSKNTYIWVIEVNNNVLGFVVGSKNFSIVFKNIIRKNFLDYILILLPQIIRKPTILSSIIETFFYTRKEGDRMPEAELIVIAILSKFHRKGLGRKLILYLEKEFIDNGVKQYKLTVNAKNKTANSFYKSLEFNKHHDFSLYGKKLNLYTKKIQ